MHRLILADAAQWPGYRKLVVYLGDYVDRGLQSRQVVDVLLDHPLPEFEAIHLLGNHDAAMLDFLEDVSVGPQWLSYGGQATLYSYGVALRPEGPEVERLLRAQASFRARVPQRHLDFLQSLSLHHVEGDYLFVHAGIQPGVPLELQERQDLLWIRHRFLDSPMDHGKVVVHGHSMSKKPEVRPNRIGIDTGASATGVLTSLVLYEGEHRFLQTSR
jgi:serine/threonine protein phosphatase 1